MREIFLITDRMAMAKNFWKMEAVMSAVLKKDIGTVWGIQLILKIIFVMVSLLKAVLLVFDKLIF